MTASETTLLKTQAETVIEDQIVDTVSYVEHLSQEDAFSTARLLIESGEYSNFKLGGILSKINGEKWTEGYGSFNDMLAAEFPTLKRRKAFYLMSIYTNLVEAEIKWSQVGHLGWTKLKELAPILTKENAEEWIAKAEKLTIIQLIEEIRKLSDGGSSDETEETKTLTTITFKVYEDQKETINDAVTKAKVEAGTEFANVAIENICLSYLTGVAPAGPQKTLKEQIADVGYADALGIISEMYENIDIKVAVTS
jgi:hypothetical protein